MNSFYLGLFGEKQTLVYLGNSSASTSMYYKKSDVNRKHFSGYNIDKKYNFNFNDLNKVKYFIKDPGTKNIVGQKNKRLHITAILSTFFFMIFLLLPALGVIHALSYPPYIDINGENAYLHGEAMKAFEIVLLDFKITKGLSVFILFGGLFLGIYFGGKMPNEENSLPIVSLPNTIKENASVSAVPVEINMVYEKRTNSDGSTTTYESDSRTAIFCFDKDFNPAVYVALSFDTNKHPKLEENIKSNIETKNRISLNINENLQLQPEYKLNLN